MTLAGLKTANKGFDRITAGITQFFLGETLMVVQSNAGKERRLRPRYGIEVQARATIQLFGSSNTHELMTQNISETGLLLICKTKMDHLSASSILEVRLFIQKDNPIRFVAKWVRNASDCSIGIVISDISVPERARLMEFLQTMQ